ncbi:MAG TPA: hypothetical protein VJ952_10045 [Opitutales bacterium]|nr:hypothetical protein [Opitutales bacterium]
MNRAEIKNSFRLALDSRPATCLWVYRNLLGYRWRPTWTCFVDDSTDLVIEGFQRSANSFAVRSFEAAQPRPLRIAHHAHLSSQIVRGVGLRKPVLLLIREPVATLASYVAVWPQTPAPVALKAYLGFYRRVQPFLGDCLVADFERVTGDFSSVVAALNQRFGTSFRSPEEDDPAETYRHLTVGQGSFRHSADPAGERRQGSDAILAALPEAALAEARSLYRQCLRTSV